MITVGKHKVRSYMKMEFAFSGIRIADKELIPVQWQLSATLVPIQKKKPTKESLPHDAEITYQRLYFWLETNLPNVIVVDADDNVGIAIATSVTNVMMVCPGAPYDEMIAELLHHKFTSLVDGHMAIGDITLKSSDTTAAFTFDCPDGAYELPGTVSEYLPYRSLHTLPWWARNDGYSFEFVMPDSIKDKTIEEFFGEVSDPMEQFDASVDEMIGEEHTDEAIIIPVSKWKPQKV